MEPIINIFHVSAEAIADSLPVVKAAASDSLSVMHENFIRAIAENNFKTNNLWIMIAATLVFIMNLGFACVETGLIRSKNATNVLFKNTVVPVIGILTFGAWGFNLMYPGAFYQGGFFGFSGFGIDAPAGAAGLIDYAEGKYSYWTDFLFQAMFAATAATIVSGAVAERIKLVAFLIFVVFFVGFVYPIVGMWDWGGGWLESRLKPNFYDFAGSSIVHTVGGYGALVGASMLGPRIGKYMDGRINPLPGHNMSLAVIGMFILWLGWFGFNGGSALSADPEKVSLVLVTTSLGAAAGCVGAFFVSWFINRTHDITMSINGILAGLVGITAGADIMAPLEATIIGLIAGILVVFSVLIFDKVKIDDPVGAISVHLVCGTWGTMAVGIFGKLASKEQFITQLIGCVSIGVTVCTLSFIIFFIINKTIGLRVSAKEELEGLDLAEHGMKAYALNVEDN
jgi:ammonium transporter, Amt family